MLTGRRWLIGVALVIGCAARASGQVTEPLQLQQDGTPIGVPKILNCRGNVSCTKSGTKVNVGTIGQKSFTLFDPLVVLDPATNDIASILPNRAAAYTITEVCCEVDDATGTTINLQRDDGSPANILSSALACATAIGSGCTSTFAGSEASIASGHNVDFVLVTNVSATRINVTIRTTTP